jgi:hydrogenase maturation factor
LIAGENGIADPFDPRVVEAYWIGNGLLDRVGIRAFAGNLSETQQLKKKISPKNLKWIIEKVPKGAKIHHSFHVFSIFTRTGHRMIAHTVQTMDECRISWGKIISKRKSGNELEAMDNKKRNTDKINDGLWVRTQKLVSAGGKLHFIDGVERKLSLPVDERKNDYKAGDYVSFHWGFVCEKISQKQAERLSFYTKHNLKLANETI